MSNLLEVANLAWKQLFGESDETRITREEFISTAKTSFAYQSLLMAWKERDEEGYFEVPSYLSTEVEKDVVNNEIDISDLKILRSLPQEVWLQNIGGLTCECKYVKSTVNLTQLLCEDDSMADSVKTYLPVGNKIKFPLGTHKKKITFLYANAGENVDGNIEVDGAIADLIRSRLIDVYGGKTPPDDKTNNTNPNLQ